MFSGQVVGETAKILSERFGKVLQKRQSMTINQREKSTSISTQMDSLIPASKISNLTQGMFVGAVADNFDERIEQKIFHCEIVVDNEKVKRETARYVNFRKLSTSSTRTATTGCRRRYKPTTTASVRKVATSGNAMTASASLNIGASASDKCEREFLFSPSSIVTRYMASKKSSECR